MAACPYRFFIALRCADFLALREKSVFPAGNTGVFERRTRIGAKCMHRLLGRSGGPVHNHSSPANQKKPKSVTALIQALP